MLPNGHRLVNLGTPLVASFWSKTFELSWSFVRSLAELIQQWDKGNSDLFANRLRIGCHSFLTND